MRATFSVGRKLAGDDPQQSGLPGAIHRDQANAIARRDVECYAVENIVRPEGFAEVGDLKHTRPLWYRCVFRLLLVYHERAPSWGRSFQAAERLKRPLPLRGLHQAGSW